MSHEEIREQFTPRTYYQHLIAEGHSAHYASSMVNHIFNSTEEN